MNGEAKAWNLVDAERRHDRALRRVSAVAWTVTLVIVVTYGVIMAIQIMHMLRLAAVGAIGGWTALLAAIPLLVVLGVISLLIAVLATIGLLLRSRTASLTEIQLRLAALEGMVAGREGSR